MRVVRKFSSIILLFWVLLLALMPRRTSAQVQELTSQEFKTAIDGGLFDAIVDVRTQEEWDEGHIENATFVMNLASNGVPDLLLGCENCTLGIYCFSGVRVRRAIDRLVDDHGFSYKNLYNGLGVDDWLDAGYSLVTGQESIPAPCHVDPDYVCIDCCDEGVSISAGVDHLSRCWLVLGLAASGFMASATFFL